MPRAALPTGVELEYETIGSPGDPPLLLISGFTAQLTSWPGEFCAMLAKAGRYVIRFDNRDCGLSTKFDGVRVDTRPIIAATRSDQPVPPVPYTLSDMADDAVGLLDHLGIDRAHIIGASMGGMIAQTIAIAHPQRCLSMISVMSTTGDPEVGQATPEAITALLTPPPRGREAFIADAARYVVFHSKKYPNVEGIMERAAADYDRSFYPQGAERQLAAIYASGPRSAKLAEVDIPTLVIHGRDDTLIAPSGAMRTAEVMPNANLLLIADMGHDFPEQRWPVMVDAIISHTAHAMR